MGKQIIMQIMIECEYCGSIYDFSENHTCPNCAAIPDKKIIAAAKAAAKAEARDEKQKTSAAAPKSDVEADKPASGMVMTVIVKLIPLWIFIIIFSTFIPQMAEESAAKKAAQNLQAVDGINYTDHSMNEAFRYDDKITLEVDDAFYSESEVVEALLPDGMKLLVIHLKGSITEDGYDSYDYDDYRRVTPYITNGTVCRKNLSYSALNSIPEIYGTASFSLNYFYSASDEKDGYWCFIVDENDSDVNLCIGEYAIENHALLLEEVHRINISAAKEDE